MTSICLDEERKTLRDHRTVILRGEIEDCVAEEFIQDMEIMTWTNSSII